jgi:HEAT repeat protein
MDKERQAAAAPPDAAGSSFGAVLEGLLITLRRTSKDIAFYPAGHPTLARSVERAASQLLAVVTGRPALRLVVSRGGFSFEGRPIGTENPQLATMASELFVRRIQEVAFSADPTPQELVAFLQVIGSDPKKLLQQGGVGKALAAQDVRQIQVNEFDFQQVGESSESQGQQAGSGGREREESTGLVEAAAGSGAASKGPMTGRDEELHADAGERRSPGRDSRARSAPSEKLDSERLASAFVQQKKQTIEELIQRLEAEAASGGLTGYGWVASRLEAAAGQAVQEDRLPDILTILRAFLRHRKADTLKTPIRERAAQAVDAVTGGNVLGYLVERIRGEAAAADPDLTAVVLNLGTPALRSLLNRLATEDQGAARERLMATLARFREVALSELAEALRGADPHLVCDVAMMLGEIGDEGCVSLLGRLMRHRTAWVRAEAVRSLARIGGESSHRLLVQSLHDSDLGVRELAVGFLGAARVRHATATLLQLVGQRALVGQPFAVRKAAVAALGSVGGPASIPALTSVLYIRTWLRRAAGEQLRRAAALALAGMAHAEAREVVETGARSRRRDVRRACAGALREVAVPVATTD